MRFNYGALEVHKQKAHAHFKAIRWALPKITKLPLINHQFSCSPSFLSSHLSALPTNFQIPHKKIYNKFSNQLRKKKIYPLQIRIPQNAKQKNIKI